MILYIRYYSESISGPLVDGNQQGTRSRTKQTLFTKSSWQAANKEALTQQLREELLAARWEVVWRGWILSNGHLVIFIRIWFAVKLEEGKWHRVATFNTDGHFHYPKILIVGSFADGILICSLEAKILGCGVGEGLIVSRCWLDGGSNFGCWCLFHPWLPYKPNMAPSDGTRPRHPHPAMASKHITTSAAKVATHMPHTIGRKNPL